MSKLYSSLPDSGLLAGYCLSSPLSWCALSHPEAHLLFLRSGWWARQSDNLHTVFVPCNKESCSTNVMVAVALKAFFYEQCLRKDLPSLQPHGHISCAIPPNLCFFVTALSLLLCWCFYLQRHVIKQIRVGNNPFSDFTFIQISYAHNVVKEQKCAKQWAWKLGCSFVGLQLPQTQLKLSLQAYQEIGGD